MLTSFVKRAIFPPNSRCLTMQAWRIANSSSSDDQAGYGQNDEDFTSKLSIQECTVPTVATSEDVLIKVHASSVNPIDLRMYNGYGRKVLDWMFWLGDFSPRISSDRHPLILGRDFSGEVVALGNSTNDLKIGDLVYGVIEPHKQGAHAHYVTSPQYCLHRKPHNLSHIEASSIPFVALTAWSALCTFGQLNSNNCQDKRVLVLGGSGGVGSFSIQLLKGWGAHVTATCSDDNIDWLESTLMVDQVVSYDDVVELDNLKNSFDFVLDAGRYNSRQQIIDSSTKFLKAFKGSTYVTISPPVLDNTDKFGVLAGTLKSGFEALGDTLKGLEHLNSVRWAFFTPNRYALSQITHMIEKDIVKPIVHDTFSFSELPQAYSKLKNGRIRGKIVIDHTDKPERK